MQAKNVINPGCGNRTSVPGFGIYGNGSSEGFPWWQVLMNSLKKIFTSKKPLNGKTKRLKTMSRFWSFCFVLG